MDTSNTTQIALCQLPTFKGTREELTQDILQRDAQMAEKGAHIVVYPWTYFGVSFGSNFDTLGTGSLFLHGWLSQLAQKLTVPTLLPVSLLTQEDSFTDIAFINQGEATCLFSNGMRLFSDENGNSDLPIVELEINEMDFGIATNQETVEPFTSGEENVDGIIFIPGSGIDVNLKEYGGYFSYCNPEKQKDIESANAFFIEANGVGLMEEQIFAGLSYVITPEQETAYVAPMCTEDIKIVPLDGTILPSSKLPFLNKKGARQLVNSFPYPFLVRALSDMVYQEGARGAHLLLKGDLASSLLCVLALDALGPRQVFATVAEGLSNSEQLAAKKVIQRTKVHELPLNDAEKTACNVSPHAVFASATLSRMHAREKGLLLLTAEDQSALALGQDVDNFGEAAFAPFANVFRTELQKLAKVRSHRGPQSLLPARCFTESGLNYRSRLYTAIQKAFNQESDEFKEHWEAPSVLIDSVLYAYLTLGMNEEMLYAENPDLALYGPHILHIFKVNSLMRRKVPFSPALSIVSRLGEYFPVMGAWQHYDARGVTKEKLDTEAKLVGEEILETFEQFFNKYFSQSYSEQEQAEKELEQTIEDLSFGPFMSEDRDDFFGQGLMGEN